MIVVALLTGVDGHNEKHVCRFRNLVCDSSGRGVRRDGHAGFHLPFVDSINERGGVG